MKSYHEPIDVTVGDDGLPRSWRWRQSVWRVLKILDRWVLQSRWWTGEAGEEKRDYLLVEAAPESMDSCAVEIYLKGDGDAWILARILH
ncbi:MAG TPA: DUF6504 family protein [Candidatus Latescibacteria bacterium]|jgi:hypothetical protein|nr:hypothetical protein [Gemmatimonadaceae bacterium]MDP6017244.1 DUF6504 family protein [Candidatus Latescibacterota bacterium]HJP30454.1 DUF6504 family protein [Candidatus Latescibacterota bacterium]|tara:strand:- start:1262 stop:1528 length:267 start_codon:yes stop_codon:yes gene_type:complete